MHGPTDTGVLWPLPVWAGVGVCAVLFCAPVRVLAVCARPPRPCVFEQYMIGDQIGALRYTYGFIDTVCVCVYGYAIIHFYHEPLSVMDDARWRE